MIEWGEPLASILEAHPDPVVVLDGDRKVVGGNEAARALPGIVSGTTFDPSPYRRAESRYREYPLPDGRTAATWTNASSEQNRIRELEQEAERWRFYEQGSSDGFWDYNPVTHALYLSPSYRALLDLGEQELPNDLSAWWHYVHPDDSERLGKEVRAHVESRETNLVLNYRLRHRDGSYRWFLSRGRTVRDESGQAVRIAGTQIDVTALHDAQNRLLHESQVNAAILAAAGSLIIVIDPEGKVVRFNAQCVALTGIAERDIVGTGGWFDLLHPEEQGDVFRVFDKLRAGDFPSTYENLWRGRGGDWRRVRWNNTAVCDTEGKVTHIVSCGTDITDQRALESRLAQARDEAVAANQAKSRFLASVSHEIRTPLNGVLGMAEVIANEEMSPFAREGLQTIIDSGNDLRRIIDDILDFTKLESGRMGLEVGAVQLEDIVHDVLRLHGSRATAKGLRLEVTLPEKLSPHVVGDAVRLKQALGNLVDNAIKFTHQGGIRVSLETDDQGRDVVATMRVADTGIGIDPQHVPNLFGHFTQAGPHIHRDFGGTGLGLAITRQIVEMMHGTISLASKPGEGTTVVVNIPFECAMYGDIRRVSPLKGLRVLVAEDNPTNVAVIRRLLERLGCSVQVAENGAEARNLYFNEPFDAVLMDLMMPEVDGIEAAMAIRGAGSSVPILAVTASALEEDRIRCEQAGMNGYLTKPVTLDRLAKALSEAVGAAQ